MSDFSTPSPTVPSSGSQSVEGTPPPGTPPNLHQNSIDPAALWLVQKYGGTSVGKFADRIAEEIIPAYLDQHKLAIVCSARSGSTKALGTTNLLLRAASEALQRTPPAASVPATPGGAVTPFPFSSSLGFLRERSSRPPSVVQSPVMTGANSRSGSPPSLSNSLVLTPVTEPPVPEAPPFSKTVDVIRDEHVKAARKAVVNSAEILKDLEEEIERDCEGLRSFLYATSVIDEISPRSRDSIIGFGEKLGCKIITAALRDRGIDAEFVSLENIIPPTDDGEGTLGQPFYDAVSAVFAERIRQCGSRVPVVTGFFGPVPGSLLRQVGRGYTDLCAALLAAGLGASELQIWKEVDGIFTADPRKVPTARLIPIISPEEAAELTYYGSEVVHPFTMEQVIRRKIPIRIKNVENPQGGGTVIKPDEEVDAAEGVEGSGMTTPPSAGAGGTPALTLAALSALSFTGPDDGTHPAHRRLPTAVTIKERIIVLNVNSNRKSVSHGFLAGIFGTLDRFGVVVDLISTSEVHVSMAIEDVLEKRVVQRLVRELEKSGSVSLHRDMAILSLVGKQMRHSIGIAGRMFTTLAQGNINIEMISQGANEINISTVIEGRNAVKALNLIHQSCLQIKRDEGAKGRVGPWLF
ncbi:aspartate kinase [Stereum hirsutum FP-91666 SS1]|uniref:aspartate kinase n=1 Tax=Stereum hirsutum (strain FP-91666) TaxID=721885 RepID=UPI00044493BD|nr:aspartate kinase [Stereum hirsutum FP-91666 SS1]EIM81965.1 aspartate kinase [Stereum hirsutum FP-91666 SS1]